ncbi:hypothetical protein GCM10010435_44180 [Winogradskya consettensis]|uniref:Uncharacterized protein n=1 Tax=Winogradskya consettensis TaxID=113560 RepID=A0A919VYE7_9ACTN|nr:hypothetical protein [Actinoplanes consettensis]GIM82648.1 hypothetical protein Aco04nite_82570 [Actinoplanes consettensis]
MNGPSRFEIKPDQIACNARGVAQCRDAIAPYLASRINPEPERPLTPSEEIHRLALKRAIGERRNQRLIGLEQASDIFDRLPIKVVAHA